MIWKEFKEARNKVNNSIKKGKRKYFRRNWTQINVIYAKHGGESMKSNLANANLLKSLC